MFYRLRTAGSRLPEPVKRPAKAIWYASGRRSARAFSRYFYTRADLTWNNTSFLGVPLWKNPLDLWVYQEILWEVRPARFASAERGLEQFGYNVFEFLVLMDSANFDFTHEFVRKIEGRFHFAIFPESCFSVNLAQFPPAE